MAVISFMRRHSKTHLADYFEITLAEWKHCCILYAESHMVKKCYNQFYSDKTGLIYGVFLWMSLQCLIGVFFFFFQCTFSLHAAVPLKQFFSIEFFSSSLFFFLSLFKTNKQTRLWDLCDHFLFQHHTCWVLVFCLNICVSQSEDSS